MRHTLLTAVASGVLLLISACDTVSNTFGSDKDSPVVMARNQTPLGVWQLRLSEAAVSSATGADRIVLGMPYGAVNASSRVRRGSVLPGAPGQQLGV